MVARRKPYNTHRHEEARESNSQDDHQSQGEPSAQQMANGGRSGHGHVVAEIQLADFSKGYEELFEHFRSRQLPHSNGEKYYYNLKPEDIDYFNSYSNVFEG